ncbi:hypothetical protein SEPCBS119000_000903 [Sporothrix epigloea]|uniref:Peptidase S53 domain-containing protein n=1 Tax=Sporothrix epigloea TaxID=1892477 RepID=A0ABP0DBK7_9PEZI
MHLNALTCAAILGYFSLQAAAGPVPDDSSLASYARQAQNMDNVVESTYKKTKRVIPDTHALHERQPLSWASRWQRTKRAAPDAILPMRIGLKQRNVDEGHDRLMTLSDPKSPDYGKHMSAEEVIAFFAPHRTTVEVVVDWLTSAGIHIDRISQSANKQWIQFDATVSEAEELLMTEYHIYEHTASGDNDLAAEDYHVPHQVREHIDYVTPGIRLRRDLGNDRRLQHRQQVEDEDRRRSLHARYMGKVDLGSYSPDLVMSFPPTNLTNCDRFVTPECIRHLYGIPLGSTAYPGNEMGIFETFSLYYSKEDLNLFFEKFAPFVPNGTCPIPRLIDGAIGDTAQPYAGSESNLDLQSAIPLIYPQDTVLFQVDDVHIENGELMHTSNYKGFFNTFFDAIDGSYCSFEAFGEKGNCVTPECLDPVYPDPAPYGYNGTLQCGIYKPTNVISISYGYGEADLPDYYVKRQCLEIMKLGLQGVTVVAASGDSGVGSYYDDGGNIDGCGGNGTIFYPTALVACPYVLAVGSTLMQAAEPASPGQIPLYKERSTESFASGGGFSNYFPTPNWQVQAVRDYFEHTELNFTGYHDMGNRNFSDVGDGVYHIGGRGYPDVSAIGDRFVIALKGRWSPGGGTSLSAPIWGAVLTLINEHRLANGMRTLGFVTPALYTYPEVLNDVTVGSNPGCGSPGFTAGKGWDPVSGLGTPNFPKMLDLFMHFTKNS